MSDHSEHQTCGRCGATPPHGFALIGDVPYCHPDEGWLPDCYHLATVYSNGWEPPRMEHRRLAAAIAEIDRLQADVSVMHRSVVHQCCEDVGALRAALADLYRFVQTEFESEPYGNPLPSYLVPGSLAHQAAVALDQATDWSPSAAATATSESDHLRHASQCPCLNDSAECCRPGCSCHPTATSTSEESAHG